MMRERPPRDEADQGAGRLGLSAIADRSPGSPFAGRCGHWYGEGYCLAEAVAHARCEVHRPKKTELEAKPKTEAGEKSSVQLPAKTRAERATNGEGGPESEQAPEKSSTDGARRRRRADAGDKRGRSEAVSEGMRRYHERRREEKAAKREAAERPVQFGSPRDAPLARAGDPYPVATWPKTPDERKLFDRLKIEGGTGPAGAALRLWRAGWNAKAIAERLETLL